MRNVHPFHRASATLVRALVAITLSCGLLAGAGSLDTALASTAQHSTAGSRVRRRSHRVSDIRISERNRRRSSSALRSASTPSEEYTSTVPRRTRTSGSRHASSSRPAPTRTRTPAPSDYGVSTAPVSLGTPTTTATAPSTPVITTVAASTATVPATTASVATSTATMATTTTTAQAGTVTAPAPTTTPSTTPAPGASAATSAGTDAAASLGTGILDPTPSDPSGIPMPTGDIPGWTQEFADDFGSSENTSTGSFSSCFWGSTVMTSQCTGLGSNVAAQWFAYPDGGPDTTGAGTYEPSQDLSIADNTLNMDLHVDPSTGKPAVAAISPKIGGDDGDGQLYGTFSVRFRTTSAQGYSLAFLLWPDDNVWPEHSEIDFPETDDQLGGNVSAYMHWMGATNPGEQDVYDAATTTTQWHTYTIEWTPDAVRFFVDGVTVGVSTEHVPSDPMHWVLQTAANLSGTPAVAGVPADVQIAWVAAYSMD